MANPSIAKALSALEIATMTPEERRSYFARMAALSDEKSLVKYNFTKGLEEGIEKGIEKGRQEGKQEGKQEGRQEGRQEGLEQGKVETLKAGVKSLALKKFCSLSDKALHQIDLLKAQQLEMLLEQIIELSNAQEFEKKLEEMINQ